MMPQQHQRLTRVFRKPEVMVQARCDIHPWMSSWIGVVEHPFFAVTDDQGAFSISGLPPGTFDIAVWHEQLGTAHGSVTVEPGELSSMHIELDGDPGD